MPATIARNLTSAFVLGVDGCPNGWIAIRLFPHKGYPLTPDVRVFETFRALMRSEWGQADLIIVDIPIGLADSGRRGCDSLARKLLGPKRSSSVFPAPRRPMITMSTYEEANEWGKNQGKLAGGGISRQSWNITSKICEVDNELTPKLQSRIREGHPEIAFHRLNQHKPVLEPKKSKSGAGKRKNLLYHNGLTNIDQSWQIFTERHNRKPANEDDFLDACALALTGGAIFKGKDVHHLTMGRCDARGLIMEIWG